MAEPIPRASSGSFFAPKRTSTIRRMMIKSGPPRLGSKAKKLIMGKHLPISLNCKIFHGKPGLCYVETGDLIMVAALRAFILTGLLLVLVPASRGATLAGQRV